MNFVFPTVQKIKKPVPTVKKEGSVEEGHKRNSAVSRMAALEDENEKLKLKVEAVTKAFANYVTKTEFDSQDSQTKVGMVQLQNIMTAVKEEAAKMTQIVNVLQEDLKSKTDENCSLRSEIKVLKNKVSVIEVQVEKNKKPERIPCSFCTKLCNSENSFRRHIIDKHNNLQNLNKT